MKPRDIPVLREIKVNGQKLVRRDGSVRAVSWQGVFTKPNRRPKPKRYYTNRPHK